MGLRDILIFTALALAYRLIFRQRGRTWFLMVSSALAIYWLQPLAPIRYMDFWLPTATLGLVVLTWVITTPPEGRSWRANWPAAAVLAGVVLLVGATRFLSQDGLLTAGRPPAFEQVALGVVVIAGLGWLLSLQFKTPGTYPKDKETTFLYPKNRRFFGYKKVVSSTVIVLLLALLVVLKLPALTQLASAGLRALMGQEASLATATDLRWLGFSYVAFRLISTLRERQNGRLPLVTLQEYVIYVIFFPAYTAGPIDRLERFIKDLRAGSVPSGSATAGNQKSMPSGSATTSDQKATAADPKNLKAPAGNAGSDYLAAGERLVMGLFKKFVVADGLALVALNAGNAAQLHSAGWAWILLYAYSLQIFFDFSGYTDIAIGLGRLLGIVLPENFNAPYLKPNLTQFWNNWHMTLTQWFRAYYFNPFTRWLRTGGRKLSAAAIIFVTQISTFVLIGLWHGITWNFVLWGAWHGVGLFVQNRYSEWVRPHLPDLSARPALKQGLAVFGGLLTFHYVALGWVWFALPSAGLSWQVFLKLFGVR
jgi:D-alanyl-lipoteichoic acid acyltransferase DltB (MBOAT superfamily)